MNPLMRPLGRMALVAVLSLVAALVLAWVALDSGSTLTVMPTAWWGPVELSHGIVAAVSAAGCAAAAWHLLSSLLACAVLIAEGAPFASGDDGADRPWLHGLARAGRSALERWGAPVARRAVVGAIVVGAVSSPAMALPSAGLPDDLGWRPTATAAPADGGASGKAAGASSGPSTTPEGSGTTRQSGAADGTGSAAATARPAAEAALTSQGAGTASASDAAESGHAPQTGSTADAPSAGATSETGAAGGGAGGGPSQTEAPSARTHVVRPGESLWSVAAEVLGPGASDAEIARAWPLLHEANRAAVGEDPGLLRPGTVLVLPSSLIAAR